MVTRTLSDESFQVVDRCFARTATTVWWGAEKLEEADAATFEVVEGEDGLKYAKDKNRAYREYPVWYVSTGPIHERSPRR